MIKSNMGCVTIDGSKTQILAEFSIIVTSLLNDAEIDKETIERAFKEGFVTKEEMKEQSKKLRKEILNSLDKILENLEERLNDGNKDE